MALKFRRSISFNFPHSSSADAAAGSSKSSSYHVRSTSLLVHSHPLIAQLTDRVAAVRVWAAAAASHDDDSLADGAARLLQVITALVELFGHPQAQDPLRRLRHSKWSERLLDDLLRLADIYGSFRDAVVTLAQLQAETAAAVRRSNQARLVSSVRAQHLADREIARLASLVRALARPWPAITVEGAAEALVAAIGDALSAAGSASGSVFAALAAISAASTAGVGGSTWVAWAFPLTLPARRVLPPPSNAVAVKRATRIWWVADLGRWMWRAKRRSAKKAPQRSVSAPASASRTPELLLRNKAEGEKEGMAERLELLERSLGVAENHGEKVFRALVNARVSLLNIWTPSF